MGALVILKNYFLHTLTINLCPRASFYFRYCSADKLNYTLRDFRAKRLSRRCLSRTPPRAHPNFLITFQFTACTTSSLFRSGLIKLYLIKVASHHWSYANAVLLVWCSDACILISDFEIRGKLWTHASEAIKILIKIQTCHKENFHEQNYQKQKVRLNSSKKWK